MLLPSILFQHSNLRLPRRVDRKLARAIVTPRMHGIHHSRIDEETKSNYASLFTWWDVLHGTLRLDVPQDDITIASQPSVARSDSNRSCFPATSTASASIGLSSTMSNFMVRTN